MNKESHNHTLKPALANRAAIAAIRSYQFALSPIIPGRCRFYPSCSEYARESFGRFGFFKALLKSTYRILRCNPFSRGYFDPVVPEEADSSELPDHSIIQDAIKSA